MPLSNKIKKVIFSVLIFFLLLFTVEIISKVLLSSYYKSIIRSYNVDYSFSESLIGDTTPNQKKFELNYAGRPFYVSFNDIGTRNSLNFCKECQNIYVFGDSQVFGLLINQQDTFVEKIQNKLQKNIRIYNLGVTGTGIRDSLEQYESKFLSKIKDSTIIYLFGFNDIQELTYNTTGSKRSKIKKYNNSLSKKIKIFLKKYLATYELLSFIKNKNVENISLAKHNELLFKYNLINTNNFNKFDTIESTKIFSLFDKYLIEFNNLTKNDNNKFIAIYGPTYIAIDDKNFQIDKYLNSQKNYTLLNLKKKFSIYNLRDIIHYDIHDQKFSERYLNDDHYTRLANNLIADFIYDYLIKSGILNKYEFNNKP